MSTIEELFGRNSSGSGLEDQEYGHRDSVAQNTRHPLPAKVDTNGAGKRRSLCRFCLSRIEATEFICLFVCLFVCFFACFFCSPILCIAPIVKSGERNRKT
jgi:hypothetical protein